jgi:hypothetical protein
VTGKASPAAGSKAVKRTPSKRNKPVVVPIHKYPSCVCASALTLLGAPSFSVHAVWTNCLIARSGSSANAHVAVAHIASQANLRLIDVKNHSTPHLREHQSLLEMKKEENIARGMPPITTIPAAC